MTGMLHINIRVVDRFPTFFFLLLKPSSLLNFVHFCDTEGLTDMKTGVHQHPHVEMVEVEKYGTERDMGDMTRMGKIQSLKVMRAVSTDLGAIA